jgi:hypothetical protein
MDPDDLFCDENYTLEPLDDLEEHEKNLVFQDGQGELDDDCEKYAVDPLDVTEDEPEFNDETPLAVALEDQGEIFDE